jgi:hypothetical protein
LPNGEKQPRAYKSRVKLKRKNRARRSNSAYDSNSGLDFDFAKDFGYNSLSNDKSNFDSDADTKDINIKQIMREFEEKGVTLSNPYNETKEIIEVELKK